MVAEEFASLTECRLLRDSAIAIIGADVTIELTALSSSVLLRPRNELPAMFEGPRSVSPVTLSLINLNKCPWN